MRLIDADALLEQMKHRKDYVGRQSDAVCIVKDAPEVVCKCSECMFWDSDSGLSARMCGRWGKFTTKNEFCSRFFKL